MIIAHLDSLTDKVPTECPRNKVEDQRGKKGEKRVWNDKKDSMGNVFGFPNSTLSNER
jgi:hypothetical protein